MKRLLPLSLSLSIVFLAAITSLPAGGQQADQDPASIARGNQMRLGVPPQHANEAQMPASGAVTTESAKTFSGTVVRENGETVLKDPVTKVIYKLDAQPKRSNISARK